MWAMMQKFRICAGAVKVLSAKLLMRAPVFSVGPAGPVVSRIGRPRPDTKLAGMAPTWSDLGKQLGTIARQQGPKLVRTQGPKLLEQLQKWTGGTAEQPPAKPTTPGRPVTSKSVPTAQRARRVVYAPQLDGRADPGEIVWTWVTYEEDASKGKDRPVLVVGRDGKTLLGLMLSSNTERADDRNWLGIGSGPWDGQGRPSWVRLDRVLDVPEAGIRREGAVLERQKFDKVAARLVTEYGWH